MRARFSAFARGELELLYRTLHPDHDDRRRPKDEVLAHLAEGLEVLRYKRLDVLDTRPPDAEGIAQVLFLATVWQKGKDLSFVELSSFAHDGEGWRYLFGAPVLRSRIAGDPLRLRIATFDPDAG
jgi:SEC-C motif-containing protein